MVQTRQNVLTLDKTSSRINLNNNKWGVMVMFEVSDEEIIDVVKNKNRYYYVKEKVDEKIKSMGKDEIIKLASIEKIKKKTNYILYLIFGTIFSCISLFMICAYLISNEFSAGAIIYGILLLVVAVVLFIIGFVMYGPKKINKNTDEYWAKIVLKERLNDEIDYVLEKEKDSMYEGKKIKYTLIIDSYTEYSDKLHAFLNYQEIIQTRYYKFKVVLEDDTSVIVDVKEDSEDYIKFMKYLNDDEEIIKIKNIDTTEEIRKYKKLYDDGIITKEEFENKKKDLLK